MLHSTLGRRLSLWLPVLVIFYLGLSACSGLDPLLNPPSEQEQYYRPPTVAAIKPVLLPTPTAAPTEKNPTDLLPSATPACTNYLRYLEDLTIPDGTLVQPGEALDKQWLVENSGTCNWGELYRLKLVAGQDLGFPVESALYPARSGTQTTIQIRFTAPQEPNAYRSAWQAYDPEDTAFGDLIFIEFVVP